MDKSPIILVIDDDLEFVKATRTILENKGYRIEAAYNKEDALEKVAKIKPDLILLDIMMEKFNDGFIICFKLKEDPELKNIPVLYISAITQKTGFKFNPEIDGEYFWADDYIKKPVKPSDLLERVEKLLER